MLETYLVKTKILDGSMSLGRSCINKASMQIDGKPVPELFLVDDRAGVIQWADQQDIPGPEDADYRKVYEITFQYFRPAQVMIRVDALDVALGETITVDVFCEDITTEMVTIAIFNFYEKIGVLEVPLNNGAGSSTLEIELAGSYLLRVDEDAVDSKWGLPMFSSNQVRVTGG